MIYQTTIYSPNSKTWHKSYTTHHCFLRSHRPKSHKTYQSHGQVKVKPKGSRMYSETSHEKKPVESRDPHRKKNETD